MTSNAFFHYFNQFYILDAYQAFKSKTNENGAFYIFGHFDTFFSVIENVSRLKFATLQRVVDILYLTAENLGDMLDAYLKQETLDRQNAFLNLIKMVMYLLVTTIRVVDKFVKDNLKEQVLYLATYEAKRYDVLVLVCNIMGMPIEKLWEMSAIEENFVK